MKLPPRFLLFLPLAVLCLDGCRNDGAANPVATTNATVVTEPIKAVPDKDRYKVKANTTGLFHYSPLQAAGADVDLKKNARLTMLKRGRGFSQVKTTDDQVGYVGTEDITPLTPAEIAQEDAATIQAAQAAAGVQAAGLPLAAAGLSTAPSRGGIAKKPQNTAPAVSIPTDAGRNEPLPEASATPRPRPSATPR